MTVSCADSRAWAVPGLGLVMGLGLAIGFGLTLPLAAVADQLVQSLPANAAPVTLAPPQSLTSKPVGSAPLKPSPDVQVKPATAGNGIKVDTLGEIDADSVGLLDAAGGGFGVAMWQGTARKLVERLLPQLPDAPKSVIARKLYRKLLLSAAETPVGSRPKGAPSLVSMRIGRLLAQGDIVSAQALLRVVPVRTTDEAIALDRARVALLMNDNAGACAVIRGRLGDYPNIFWRKGQVFCQLLTGDTAGASIGAGLLTEQGVDDAPFYALTRILGGEKGVAVGGLEKPTPLHMAMMRASRVQVPPGLFGDNVSRSTAVVLRTVALSPNADLDTRLEAAERAEMRGALNADALIQLYLSVNFTPDELSGALSSAATLSGPRGRALLFRAARNQNVASAQAEIISRALTLARPQGRLGTAVRVFVPQLSALDASEDLAWFAAEAGAALHYAGLAEAGAKWDALAAAKPNAAAKSPTAGATMKIPADAVLWPFAALAALPAPKAIESGSVVVAASDGASTSVETIKVQPLNPAEVGSQGFDIAGFNRWWQGAVALGGEQRSARAARILVLMEALGASVPGEVWSRLVVIGRETPSLPPVGLMAQLKRAAAAGHIGETVLLALTALGADTPGQTDVRVLGPVVRALHAIGLTDAARGLAVEAIFEAHS
ncbi:MAG: hypothetical protein ACI82H_000238 [Alphaproteobacteria bacterium]|jgi:hypothetical protein